MMACVEFREVGKSFRQRDIRSESFWGKLMRPWLWRESALEVLKAISFTVQPGEKIALLGPNGAGKSTLLRLIAGILRPTSGEIRVQGRVAPLLQLGVGFHAELTGRENVFLSCSLFGLSRSQTARIYDEIVDFAELEEFMDRPVKHYSCGMTARLGFAVSTSLDADLYLLDEGLNAGDVAFRDKCQERIQQLLKRDKTWIISTHSLSELDQHCNRAFLLDDGRLVVQQSIKQAADSYRRLCLKRQLLPLRQIRLEADAIHWNDSRRIELQPGRFQGKITRVLLEERGPVLVGWAFDEQKRRAAEEVLVFAEGQCLGRFPVRDERPGVASALNTQDTALGFRANLSKDWLPDHLVSGLRLFALSQDGAGELQPRVPPAVLAVAEREHGGRWVAQVLKECAPDRFVSEPQSLLEDGALPGRVYAPVCLTQSQLQASLEVLNEDYRSFFLARDLRDSLMSIYENLDLKEEEKESALLRLIQERLDPVAALQRCWVASRTPIFLYEELWREPFAQMRRLLDFCEIPISDRDLREVLDNNSLAHQGGGGPGSWRKHFTPQVAEAFKAAYGDLLIATGYEKDLLWNLEESRNEV